MLSILLDAINSTKECISETNNAQRNINTEVSDALLETYETTETNTAELEDAIIELYEMISE